MNKIDNCSGTGSSMNSQQTGTSSTTKKAWHKPFLINLNLVDTSVGKGTSPSEGCHPSNGQCKPQWVDSFGPS